MALLTSLFFSPVAVAQSNVSQLRVAVGILPPFVMEQNGELRGFSIDLWNAIAARLKVSTSYQTFTSAKSLEDALRSKTVDIIASPVVITAARDEGFRFLTSDVAKWVADPSAGYRPNGPTFESLEGYAGFAPFANNRGLARHCIVDGRDSRSYRLAIRAEPTR